MPTLSESDSPVVKRLVSTRIQLENAPYPVITVLWTEDSSGTGWRGQVSIWTDGNTKYCDKHTLRVAMGMPIGVIVAYIDEAPYSSKGMASFHGDTLSHRDLHWATVWAGEVLSRWHRANGTEHCVHPDEMNARYAERDKLREERASSAISSVPPAV